jgi:hypothetical protein
LAVFQLVFHLFLLPTQIFLREKKTKNKMKNSQKTAKKRYREPPPPGILEKQLKNKFQMSSA